jgi:DNA polymerase-3 subunit alpha
LFAEAEAHGVKSFALTDINSTSSVLDFLRLAPENNIKPVVGIDFRNARLPSGGQRGGGQGAVQKYVGLARNNDGFRELNEHLTAHSHAEQPFDDRAPEFSDAYVIYPWNPARPDHPGGDTTPRVNDLRDNEYIGIRPSQVNKLMFSELKDHQHKLVVLAPVTFRNKKDFNAHRLLRAIDQNLLLSMLPKTEEALQDEIGMSEDELRMLFIQYPMIVKNTKFVLGDCNIHFNYKSNKNKKFYTGSAAEDFELIRRETEKGLIYRYGSLDVPTNVSDRVQKELKLIRELDFCSYFLINWDMVNYARSQNYFYVGRGSGANSIVAYLLRITDVDPIELDLYFERFINPYRTSPPDFDIDFSSYERNDVTKYLFDRHGWEHTALVGAYNTFQGRAVVRELGKVFGLPSDEIDRLQAAKNLSQVDEMGMLVLKYTEHIQGFPSHLSVHSSGVIISQLPISTYSATIMPPKGFPTVHFSMLEAEDIGLSKFDILGQRGLGKIKDSITLIRENTGDEFDIHDLPRFKKDPEIKKYLKAGDAIGCFYVESPAMRMLLTKLRADDYLRLVAASSIIRPGVSQSGMMNEYIERFHHEEKRAAAREQLPELYDILAETFGVMVYQEDVLKVAHYFADLSLAEADILRRGMSWKFRERSQFDLVKANFFKNCKEKGYRERTIHGIWTQIESFANYAFSKGHSASYAVESYQALFLKAHYPLEYMVATLNNGGGFYRKEIYLREAKRHGAIIQLPCVNQSGAMCNIYGKEIFLGLGFVGDMELPVIENILRARVDGPFENLRDFLSRVPITLAQLVPLIRIGAFRFTGKGKKELLWDAHFLLSESKKTAPTPNLFEVEVKEFTIPELWSHELEDPLTELEYLGFTISTSPFHLLKDPPELPLRAKDIPANIGKEVTMLLYLVTVKYTQTNKGVSMNFGTWYDADENWVDSVHFPNSAAMYPFQGPGCYIVKAIVIEEYGFFTLDVQTMERVAMKDMEVVTSRLKPIEVVGESRQVQQLD